MTTRYPSRKLTVTLVQSSAGVDPARNLAALDRMLAGVARTDLIVLPEVFALRGNTRDFRDSAQPIRRHPIVDWLRAAAQCKRAWCLGGSVMERAGGKIYNTSVLVDPAGRVHATYRKIHLFEAHLPDGKVVRESDAYTAGDTPVITTIKGWRCGLAICYDLRFPELFRRYAAAAAHLLLIPSNFTQRTGIAHWRTLVRARAIENQAFVLAVNQCGTNARTRIRSYGHSMAVGPWGELLCNCGRAQGVRTVVLEPAALRETRARVPALRHRVLG